jgi:hypothetical protein
MDRYSLYNSRKVKIEKTKKIELIKIIEKINNYQELLKNGSYGDKEKSKINKKIYKLKKRKIKIMNSY